MKPVHRSPLLALVTLIALAGCSDESERPLPLEPLAHSLASSDWSEPVHLTALNSEHQEQGPKLSPDGLSLYFGSNRPGGFGGLDLYAARRACLDCPWGTPVNLGPNINSPGNEGEPVFSADGLLLFFGSHREDGLGSADIWLSRRTDRNDDLAWGPAVNVAGVNTAGHEAPGSYIPALSTGGAKLYYYAGSATDLTDWDIYQVPVSRDGEVLGPAVPVTELNSSVADVGGSVRGDGREIVFWSHRPGGVGLADIWVATRRAVADPWSTPRSLEAVNTPFADLSPGLSFDGRTLVFSAAPRARPSLGLQDLWMSVRTPSGH